MPNQLFCFPYISIQNQLSTWDIDLAARGILKCFFSTQIRKRIEVIGMEPRMKSYVHQMCQKAWRNFIFVLTD